MRCGFCNFGVHDADQHEWCAAGLHPLDIVGVYTKGQPRPRCRGCQRAASARYHASKPWKARSRQDRWLRRKRRAEAAQRRRAARVERDRAMMREWARIAFGFDPSEVASLADAMYADSSPWQRL